MSLTRIEMDPNVRLRRGHKTYAGFEDAQARGLLTRARPPETPVSVGEKVLAWESQDNIVTDAVVVDVDYERRIVILAPDWHGWRDVDDKSHGETAV